MKRIPLTQGKFSIVDDEDFEALNAHRWCVSRCEGGRFFYAARSIPRANGKQTTVLLHRVVMNAPKGMFVDHISHDTLDNRRANLRVVTNSQNMMNRKGAQRNSKTGVRGVSQILGGFRAQIQINGVVKHLGTFVTTEDAGRAYQAAAVKLFGEYRGGL